MESSQSADFNHEVLVIAPHPDDAELFCGGLLLRMNNLGYRTAVIDLSEAELSTYGSPEIRRRETEKAGALLGLTYRTNMLLPDCWFHEHSGFDLCSREGDSAAAKLTRAIRVVRPEVVIAPYWHDRHPDHIQASKLANRCLFLAGLPRYLPGELLPVRPRLVLRYPMRFDFVPSLILDISAFAARKYQVIESYSSQLTPPPGAAAQASTLLAEPLSLRAIAARDAYFGAQIGVEFGEGFLSQAAIRIDDPVKHARECPTESALLFRSEV